MKIYNSLEEWESQGKKLYGEKKRNWLFKCPSCGGIQSGQDFLDLGIPQDKVAGIYCFSCIGRYTENKGCDWTLGGLLQIHKAQVMHNGESHPVFEFAALAT